MVPAVWHAAAQGQPADARLAPGSHFHTAISVRLLFSVFRRTVALSLALLHDAISDRHTLRRVTARVLLRAVRGRTELRPRELCTWW